MSVDQPIILAALDLGSNSFHLLISQWRQGSLHPVKRHKDLVQLARAFDQDGHLDSDAMERALASLRRCRHLLDQYSVTHLRVVATQILRQCRNPEGFLRSAEAIIQAPIEIISGDEEASLVYLGVSHALNPQVRAKHILVLDMGGASTELITARNEIIDQKVSLELGCVTLANRYFSAKTRIHNSSLKSAYEHARRVFIPIKAGMHGSPIELALGASGTLRVLVDILRDRSEAESDGVIHQQQLQSLLYKLEQTGDLGDAVPDNLRWDVLPAGIAILTAFLQVFELNTIGVSTNSIKEGMMLNWVNHHPDYSH